MSDLIDLLNQFAAFLTQNPLAFLITLSLVGLAVVVSALFILRALLHFRSKASKAFHKTILLIRVPKEKKGENQQPSGEENINQLREQIAVADTLFSSIAGLRHEHGFMKWLSGRNDHLAFEIVAKDSKISFYMAVPDKLKSFVEQQVHAQYPHAEITEELDYNIFQPQCHIVGAHLCA